MNSAMRIGSSLLTYSNIMYNKTPQTAYLICSTVVYLSFFLILNVKFVLFNFYNNFAY